MKRIVIFILFTFFVGACDIDLDEDHIFFPEYWAGLLDSNDAKPYDIWQTNWPGDGLAGNGDYIYVCGYDIMTNADNSVRLGLRIIDVSAQTSMAEIGGSVACSGRSIAYASGYCYLLNASNLSVVSVADPSHPVLVTNKVFETNFLDYMNTLCVSGGFLYLDGKFGTNRLIFTYNLTDPASLSQTSVLTNWGQSASQSALFASGTWLVWLDSAYSNAVFYSLTDPSKPAYAKDIAIPGANYLSFYGNYAYVSAGGNGLKVVDLGAAGGPSVIRTLNDTNTNSVFGYYRSAVDRDRLFVNGGSYTCYYDLTTPSSPELLGIGGGVLDDSETGFYLKNGYLYTYDAIKDLGFHLPHD